MHIMLYSMIIKCGNVHMVMNEHYKIYNHAAYPNILLNASF